MPVRVWWDNARELDQEAVLIRIGLELSLVGIPWAFLPAEVQFILTQRVRINAAELDPKWRRMEHN